MWAPTISSDELYHHGILKMKWGVRNGPPYPLDQEQKSSAEKRAEGSGPRRKTSEKKEHKGLSEGQKSALKKAALVGGGVLLGAAVVGGTIYLAKTGKLDDAIRNGKKLVDGMTDITSKPVKELTAEVIDNKEYSDITNVFLKDAKAIGIPIKQENPIGAARDLKYIENELSLINPSGANNNCPAVAACHDLRARGLNIVAKGREFSQAEMDLIYPDRKFESVSSWDEFEKIALSFGEGARGEFSGQYTKEIIDIWKKKGNSLDGISEDAMKKMEQFRHTYPYEVKGGKVLLLNGQTKNGPRIYSESDTKMILSTLLEGNSLKYSRLDNLDPDLDFVHALFDPA